MKANNEENIFIPPQPNLSTRCSLSVLCRWLQAILCANQSCRLCMCYYFTSKRVNSFTSTSALQVPVGD